MFYVAPELRSSGAGVPVPGCWYREIAFPVAVDDTCPGYIFGEVSPGHTSSNSNAPIFFSIKAAVGGSFRRFDRLHIIILPLSVARRDQILEGVDRVLREILGVLTGF